MVDRVSTVRWYGDGNTDDKYVPRGDLARRDATRAPEGNLALPKAGPDQVNMTPSVSYVTVTVMDSHKAVLVAVYLIVWMTTQAGATLTKRHALWPRNGSRMQSVRPHRKSIKAVVAGVLSRLSAVRKSKIWSPLA